MTKVRFKGPIGGFSGAMDGMVFADNGERYFSMLSPEDWRGAPPHRFEGSYALEADMRWTPVMISRPSAR